MKQQRFIDLGWELLEHKCRYYVLNKPIIQDYEFDRLEREYDALAEELGLPKSTSDMVDFNMSRPSCQRVYAKLTRKVRKRRKSPSRAPRVSAPNPTQNRS